MKIYNFKKPLILLLFTMQVLTGESQQISFPGAEGSGRFSKGGRGGSVYEVTNLSTSGPGSIVDALSSGNRTVVFRVSGTIELGDLILNPKSYTTIAGQTAPGDGICIKGRIQILDVTDVIIRYIRVRVDAGVKNSSGDAIDIDKGKNIMIDHVTGSYSRDEGISCQDESNMVTVQWCIISEALTFENHGYGSLVRGDYGDEKTYHHNLYAHNNARNPRPGNYTNYTTDPEGLHFDFRNNVVYNWAGSKPGYNADTNTLSRYNFIGNVYIPGSESSGNIIFRESSSYSYGYFDNNMFNNIVQADQWRLVDLAGFTSAKVNDYKSRSYLVPMEPVTTTSPAQAKIDVLAIAGASIPKRDIIDTRIINDVKNKTGHSIATTDDQPEGGWPVLNSIAAPTDTDKDGMPDDWEDANSLDKNNPDDRNTVALNGYTMLEIYLNNIEFNYAVSNIQFSRLGENYHKIVWSDTYMSEDGFKIEKSTDGTNFTSVDSVAQNITEYIDSTLYDNPILRYRVVAVQDSFFTPYPTEYIENTSVAIKTPKDIYMGDTIQLYYNLLPTNSHNRVIKWNVRSEDVSKASVNNLGQLIALDKGTIEVTAETLDGLSISNSISLAINDTATNDIHNTNAVLESFNAFPNPFNDKIEIKINENISADAVITIYNSTGKLIAQIFPTSEQIEYSTESLPNGIYLISVQNNGEKSNRRLIKQ